jgi:hypothetical protein
MVAHSTGIIPNEDKLKAFKKCRKPSPTKQQKEQQKQKQQQQRKSFGGFLSKGRDDSSDMSSSDTSGLLQNRSFDGELRDASFEIDNDDDDEADSSFVLLYQLMFEKCVNIYLNQNQFYSLYEVRISFYELRLFLKQIYLI